MNQTDEKTGMKRTLTIIAVLGMVLWITGANGAIKKSNDAPRRDRYLLLDSRIVQDTENAKLTLGTVQKDKRNPVQMNKIFKM